MVLAARFDKQVARSRCMSLGNDALVDRSISHRAGGILLAAWPWGTTDHCRSRALLTPVRSAGQFLRSCPDMQPERWESSLGEWFATRCPTRPPGQKTTFFGPIPSFRPRFGSDSQRANTKACRNSVPDVRSGSKQQRPEQITVAAHQGGAAPGAIGAPGIEAHPPCLRRSAKAGQCPSGVTAAAGSNSTCKQPPTASTLARRSSISDRSTAWSTINSVAFASVPAKSTGSASQRKQPTAGFEITIGGPVWRIVPTTERRGERPG